MRRRSQTVHREPEQADVELGRVLPFRGRPGQLLFPGSALRSAQSGTDLPDDLAEFEKDRDEIINYRQRMLMNVIALAIVTFLVGAGVWIADTIAELQKDQDCVLQGRSNCAPIELPTTKRE